MTPASEDPRDGALYAGLAELNRHVQELKQDLARAGLGRTDTEVTDTAFPAPPEGAPGASTGSDAYAQGSRRSPRTDEQANSFGPGSDVPAAYARVSPGAEQRARDIVEAAQREADEITGSIRQQVATARQQVASANQEAARARHQARELLALGEELVVSVRRALGVFEDHGRRVETDVAWNDEQAGGPRAGIYAAPTQPPTSPAHSRPAPSLQSFLHLGPVTLTAGPLTGVASAFVLEQALERIPAVDRARVKRYVGDRVVIELNVTESVVLADELRRVLPFPFEVQAGSSSGLDIATGPRPESSVGVQHETVDDPGTTGR